MAEDFKAAAPLAGKSRELRGGSTPIIPIVIIGTGLYLAWFGVHYWMSDVKWPSDPIKAVLTGQPIPAGGAAPSGFLQGVSKGPFPGAGGAAGSAVVPSSTDAVAIAALKYQGAGYVWAGPGAPVGNWDCSSFVSKVLGEDLGLPLPGGGHFGDLGYPPHAHGPGSTAYMLYGTGIDQSQVQAGDLIVSVEHIGIAISPTQMISAQQPSTGTAVSSFPAGFPGGPPVYRRVPVSAAPSPALGPIGHI
jgi:hypothetical protein